MARARRANERRRVIVAQPRPGAYKRIGRIKTSALDGYLAPEADVVPMERGEQRDDVTTMPRRQRRAVDPKVAVIKDRLEDRTKCKARPDENKSKGGNSRSFVKWCKK